MTCRLIKTLLRTALFSSLLSLPFTALAGVEEQILLIDQTSGVAGVQRDGKRLALGAGDALQEQDLIVTDGTGRMTLRLGRHGFVEVGPNAEVGVERLPFAAYARDLKSIFSVGKGYFRVVWKHPQQSSNWPLYVYMAGQRMSLSSGEYFFHNAGAGQSACVAAGQIALQAVGGDGVDTIKPPSCVQFTANAAPVTSARDPDDWIAVRRSFNLEATAASLLPKESVVATLPPAAAPVVAKPVISTAAVPIPTVSAPTAIAPLPGSEPKVAVPAPARPNPRAAPLAVEPVAAAPVVATPAAAPRTTVAPIIAAPAPAPASASTPPPAALPLTKTSPIFIGQVQQIPAASVPVSAPVVAKPVASAPAGLPASSRDGPWSLNVASYTEATVAEQEVTRLRGAGYGSASTQPVNIGGKTWHRVQISGFASDVAARAAALQLKEKLGLQNVWVLKP